MVTENTSIPRRAIRANRPPAKIHRTIRSSGRLPEQAVATRRRRLHRERRRAKALSLNDPFGAEEGAARNSNARPREPGSAASRAAYVTLGRKRGLAKK